MTRPSAAVIGGGLGGMGAALCLASRGWSVTLLEAGRQLGSGWTSEAWMGEEVDLGLRIPCETGIPWADALLFHDLPRLAGSPLQWNRLGPWPLEAQVDGAGRLRVGTSCLDARFLSAPLLARAVSEVKARAEAPDPRAAAPHLAARLEAVFGPTLLEHVLTPACRSLMGQPPEALAWNAGDLRLPARMVVADAAETSLMMRQGLLAHRLGHGEAVPAPAEPGAPSYLYPLQGGIGRWRASLEAALLRAGVTLRLGTRPVALDECTGTIKGLTLCDGRHVATDLAVLAAPVSALPVAATPPVPQPRHAVTAVAMRFDEGMLPAPHWITSFDPATPFLRVCFVPRLRGAPAAKGGLVVAEMRAACEDELFPSLQRIGLLPAGSRPVAIRTFGRGGFAVETTDAALARGEALRAASGFRNLAVMPSALGGHALAATLLREAARIAEEWATQPAAA